MHRASRNRLILALGLLMSLILLTGPSPARANGVTRILDLQWTAQADTTNVTLKVSGPVRYRTATTATSIAVDFWTAAGSERFVPVSGGVATSVSLRQMTRDVIRLEIALRRPASHKVFTRDDRITVAVFPAWQATVPLPRSVAYQTMRVPTRSGRTRVHVVTIDPRAPGISIQPVLGGAVISTYERTSTAAARLQAVAAINGNFYTGYSGFGLPLGLIVIDGRVLSAPLARRPVFAMDASGHPWIGPVTFKGQLLPEGGRAVPISAVRIGSSVSAAAVRSSPPTATRWPLRLPNATCCSACDAARP
jgi:hypothetical protein